MRKCFRHAKVLIQTKDSNNRDCLDLIERCIFVVCLDKPVVDCANIPTEHENETTTTNNNNNDHNKYIEKEMTKYAHQMIHGCNSEHNSGNRWFDKTMQFIISEDGVCGVNYEHSPAEGIVVIELSEHLFRYM